MGVVKSITGEYTPTCNDCGIALCWDITSDDYEKDKVFWDNWKCKECNEYWMGSLKHFRANEGEEHE